MITLLPLLLATSPLAGDAEPVRKPVNVTATATVMIIRAETVEVTPTKMLTPQTDRQYRQRDSAPIVDFF